MKSETEKMHIIRHFGPTIAKVKMPTQIVEKLNEHIDRNKDDAQFVDKNDHGSQLIGNVTQEIRLEPKPAHDTGFFNFLGLATKHWVEAVTGKTPTEFKVDAIWVVRQFELEYNPAHYHSGHISGVGYLKVPKSFGGTLQEKKKKNNNGCIDFIHGSRAFTSQSTLTIKPEVGDFYLFPNYLIHTVYPFTGKDERRSISFNARIDEKIYHDYE